MANTCGWCSFSRPERFGGAGLHRTADKIATVAVTDELANERTFLTYLRTSLAFIGFGFVIARFGLFVREYITVQHGTLHPSISTPLGVLMVLAGVAIGLFGLSRYASVARALAKGGPTALSVKTAAGVVVTLIVFAVLLAIILLLAPTLA